jgi:hypothetical protein
VTGLTATAGTGPSEVPGDLLARPGQRRARVGQIRTRDDQQAVADVEGVQRGEVLGGLWHPALVGGHDDHRRRHRADTGEHVGHEAFVAGHVDERHRRAGR